MKADDYGCGHGYDDGDGNGCDGYSYDGGSGRGGNGYSYDGGGSGRGGNGYGNGDGYGHGGHGSAGYGRGNEPLRWSMLAAPDDVTGQVLLATWRCA